MSDTYVGDLKVICMPGCQKFLETVDSYLTQWRNENKPNDQKIDSFITYVECPRFGSGEAKGLIHETMRGKDIFIFCDIFNYGVTYKMYGMDVPMSPDDHFADLKRIIAAIGGKARRITVIMPMLYEGRQHRRTARESLDCALALQELTAMGVANIITFDAHDPRIVNAIPLHGFDNIRPSYQMLKALVREYPEISLDKDNIMLISPDEGAMSRSMYYASVMGVELGMFYKRRNYSVIVNGKNPIEAHEYLGKSITNKDVIVVDDMISSGESIIEVCKQLKSRGARRIFVFATFSLFCNGLDIFDTAYAEGNFDKVFSTNLTYHTQEILDKPWFAHVSMCKYVAYIIETLNRDDTISALLNPITKIHSLLDRQAAKVSQLDGSQISIEENK